jgi:hypothetical protein
MLKQTMTWLVMAVLSVITAQAQQGRWAPADDPTAKFILDAERQWQDANCDHNKITEKILADDFWGTLPDGAAYGKAEEVKETRIRRNRAATAASVIRGYACSAIISPRCTAGRFWCANSKMGATVPDA